MKVYTVFDLSLNYHEHKIFGLPNFPVFQGIHELFLKIIFNTPILFIPEEYRSPLFGSPREDPFHSPLTFCRQRSNMEIGASLIILRACPTISSKPFLLECRMKGHLHLKMEELPQPVDTLGMKVMFSMGLR